VPAAFAITREEMEVHRFSLPAAFGIPLLAVILQTYLPVYLSFFRIFDLPLLVTIYFAISRRNQVTGLLTGGAIGLLQDSLTHQPLGLFGIAKTVVGYLASSIGVKLDVDNPGSRLLLTFAFYLIHQTVYFVIARFLAEQVLVWRWGYSAMAALANSILAVFLFGFLDHLRQRA
jgi:rod shape-determining protein MreD